MDSTLSGKVSNEVLTGARDPNLEDLKRRMISCSVAATMKYSCFRRSSFPSKNCQNDSDKIKTVRQTTAIGFCSHRSKEFCSNNAIENQDIKNFYFVIQNS